MRRGPFWPSWCLLFMQERLWHRIGLASTQLSTWLASRCNPLAFPKAMKRKRMGLKHTIVSAGRLGLKSRKWKAEPSLEPHHMAAHSLRPNQYAHNQTPPPIKIVYAHCTRFTPPST